MVWKELTFNSFYLGGCDGLEITESTDLLLPGNECLNDTQTYIYEYHMVVLKELLFNTFYFGRVWWS